jgi:hypothetical protein
MLEERDNRLRHFAMKATEQEVQLREAQKSQKERRAEEQRRLDAELSKQADVLREQHLHEQYKLRSDVEDLKGALAVKKHFKGLADADLSRRFEILARNVEDFSRLKWDLLQEGDWWGQQLEQLNKRNPRRLKQHIVQNSVWISLREHIFLSPFRLFAAEEGWKELDKNWTEIYGLSKSSDVGYSSAI